MRGFRGRSWWRRRGVARDVADASLAQPACRPSIEPEVVRTAVAVPARPDWAAIDRDQGRQARDRGWFG